MLTCCKTLINQSINQSIYLSDVLNLNGMSSVRISKFLTVDFWVLNLTVVIFISVFNFVSMLSLLCWISNQQEVILAMICHKCHNQALCIHNGTVYFAKICAELHTSITNCCTVCLQRKLPYEQQNVQHWNIESFTVIALPVTCKMTLALVKNCPNKIFHVVHWIFYVIF